MSGLWFTKEQIEAEENAGRFNAPWDEKSFRSRIIQDWLTMCATIGTLRARAEKAEARAAYLEEQTRKACHLVTTDNAEKMAEMYLADWDEIHAEVDRWKRDAYRLAAELRLEQNPGYTCLALQMHDGLVGGSETTPTPEETHP